MLALRLQREFVLNQMIVKPKLTRKNIKSIDKKRGLAESGEKLHPNFKPSYISFDTCSPCCIQVYLP